MIAIATRLKTEDYAVLGDADVYDRFRIRCKENDVSRLFETTKRTVLLWGSHLFVSGIATDRKDYIKTPIRYTLLLQGANEETFDRIRGLLKENGTDLGNALDKIFSIDDSTSVFPELNKKDEERVYAAIEDQGIPLSKTSNASSSLPDHTSSFQIWSEFCPVDFDRTALEKYVSKLYLPEGTVYIKNVTTDQAPINTKKKSTWGTNQKNRKLSWAGF